MVQIKRVFDILALKHHFYPVDEFTLGDLGMVKEIIGIIVDAEKKGEVRLQFIIL